MNQGIYEAYWTALNSLSKMPATPENMAALCPHLAPEEALAAFKSPKKWVACPSLRVPDCVHLITYNEERSLLVYANALDLCSIEAKANQGVVANTLHVEKAAQFAKTQWNDRLISKAVKSVLVIWVQDLRDPIKGRFPTDVPKNKLIMHVGLDQEWREIASRSVLPKSMLIDNAIVEITLDEIIGKELIVGFADPLNAYNCAYCASPIDKNGCSGCGYQLPHDLRSSWCTPLSPKIVDFLLKHGHTFDQDPSIAWEKEREKWETSEWPFWAQLCCHQVFALYNN